LHGCGGAYNAKGQLSKRMLDYAKLMNDQGWHALVLDSFTARGVTQICTQAYSQRLITPKLRAQDVLDAHQWLSEHIDVDKDHIAYLGWSNGGSTVLAATNLNNGFVASSKLKPAGASVFYPGCVEDLKLGYRPNANMLIQVGDSDDWTPPGPCKDLVTQSASPIPEIIAYPDAYHQFDSDQEVKIRYDVGRGQGVHYGGHPQAYQASTNRLLEFLKSALRKD
jgi:dienelactone hydrolase